MIIELILYQLIRYLEVKETQSDWVPSRTGYPVGPVPSPTGTQSDRTGASLIRTIWHMMRYIAFHEIEFGFSRRHTRETEFSFHKGYNGHNGQRKGCDLSLSVASTKREK